MIADIEDFAWWWSLPISHP